MIARSVVGLLAAQALFLVAGVGILSALRPWRSWAEVVRLLGVAYLVGVAAVGVTATLLLVAGAGLGTPVVVAMSLGLAALGVGVAGARGRRPPRSWGFARPSLAPGALAGSALALLTLLVLAVFFRAARHQGVVAWDAWAFWVPKAKAVYFFGGLDEHLFRTLANPSYPLLIPALQAIDFHLMGSADATTLALQYWFFLAGFVAAAWGLLRPLVSPLLVWPFLALAAVMPELDARLLGAQADWPLEIFFAIAALCLAGWLVREEPWLLGTYAVLTAGVLATKREGQLLTACLVAAALAATWRRARFAWPRLVGLSAAAYLLNLPWRLWWMSRHLTSDAPEVGFRDLPSYAERVGPALRIVLHLLFDYQLWLLAAPLALAAAALALSRREYALPVLYLGTSILALAGFTWILWAFPSFPLDTSQQEPIPRAIGAVVLLSLVFAPLLLARALAQPTARSAHPSDGADDRPASAAPGAWTSPART